MFNFYMHIIKFYSKQKELYMVRLENADFTDNNWKSTDQITDRFLNVLKKKRLIFVQLQPLFVLLLFCNNAN